MLRPLTRTILLLALAACGSEEQGSMGYIAAQVDGAAWRAPASEGTVVYSLGSPDGAGFVYSSAFKRVQFGGEILSLDLPNPPALGVHALGGDSAYAMFASCPSQDLNDCAVWRSISSDPGTLEITAIDTAAGTISGTFAFPGHFLSDTRGGAVKSITAGAFRIHYVIPP